MREPVRKVQLLSAYLGRHVHEVVQHQGRRLRGAPATALQPLRSRHVSLAVLGIVLGAAGAGPRALSAPAGCPGLRWALGVRGMGSSAGKAEPR